MRGKSSSLKLRISMCCDFDCVDSGPRDRRLVIVFNDRDASTSPAKQQFRGNIVPHGIKSPDLHG